MDDPYNALIGSLDLGSGDVDVVVKDCIDIAGSVTTMGASALAGQPPAARNAHVVERLLAGHMRIIGKGNMHPLAFGVTGQNAWAGTPQNPRYPERICGGSSSGSAVAVACGLAEIALGTDTGGSVRMPAACCGIYGLKPTFDRVNRDGVHPERSSLDCVGPLASSLELIERAMSAIDETYRVVDVPEGISLGVVGPANSASDAFLSRSGLECVAVSLPLLDEAHKAGLTIIGREASASYAHLVDHPGLPVDIAQRLRLASLISDAEVAAAEELRTAFTAAVDQLLERHSALVMPAMPGPAPLLADASDPAKIVDQTRFLRPFNLSGHPALTIPLEDEQGAPIGLQLVGKRGHDAQLCAVARELEQAARAATPEEILP